MKLSLEVSSESLLARVMVPALSFAALLGVGIAVVVTAPAGADTPTAVLGGSLGGAPAGAFPLGAEAESAGGGAELALGVASAASAGLAIQLEIDTAKLSPIARDDDIISTLNDTISSEIEPMVREMTRAGAEMRAQWPPGELSASVRAWATRAHAGSARSGAAQRFGPRG